MFFLAYLSFSKKFILRIIKHAFLQVLKIKIFFAAQLLWKELYMVFQKFSPWILQFSAGISVSFFKIRVANLWGDIGSCKKSSIPYNDVCKLDNLFKPIATNALSFHRFWRIRSTCVTKLRCPFWTCQVLSLNSEIGHGSTCFNVIFSI